MHMEKILDKLLIFKKGSGKTDDLEFRLGSQKIVEIQNPKQRIIPHDMVHYAIEHTFPFEGFIQLVFRGYDPKKVMNVLSGFAPQLPSEYSQTSWITESLVESLQAALWSDNHAFVDFEYAYDKACEARKITPESIVEEDFSSCLELVKILSRQWEEVQVGQVLELTF
jgi:hypothetical protein